MALVETPGNLQLSTKRRHMGGRLVLVLTCAAALAGCGSAASSAGTATAKSYGADLKFADCMRAHGVPSFPDPVRTGGFPRDSGVGANSPAFQRAQKGCIPILKASASRHAPTASELAVALKYARCMRAHGVPNFPDPVTSLANRTADVLVEGPIMFPLDSTIDPSSPAFQRADAACETGHASGPPKGG